MKEQWAVLLLPYLIAILVKLTSLFLERSFMIESLDRLAAIPPPTGETFILTNQRIQVIADYVEFASLRLTVITTTIASMVSAAVLSGGGRWAPYLLVACIFFGFCLLWWILPKPIPYFNTKNSLGVRRGEMAIVAFCLYDLILAGMTVLTGRPSQT